jgi:hypothetical protein
VPIPSFPAAVRRICSVLSFANARKAVPALPAISALNVAAPFETSMRKSEPVVSVSSIVKNGVADVTAICGAVSVVPSKVKLALEVSELTPDQ